MQQPQAHVRIDFSAHCALGPGKVALLEGISRSGSLSAAARALGMSYRRGWLLLHSINTGFSEPAVTLSAGGKDGGGARLTAFGEDLVRRYRQFESAVDALAEQSFSGVLPSPHPPTVEPAVPVTRRALNRSINGTGHEPNKR